MGVSIRIRESTIRRHFRGSLHERHASVQASTNAVLFHVRRRNFAGSFANLLLPPAKYLKVHSNVRMLVELEVHGRYERQPKPIKVEGGLWKCYISSEASVEASIGTSMALSHGNCHY